ncbi:hypothetical protein E2C01_018824 [Portunus trituberculatus]|uniref:Uncharacterized protein n=1 Tax=Portunus trituberculatus TaxID=210409 RepID=A0A5B7DVP3_PORTR|nr:hypothetical protein [Portunus trituberculatus]
MSLAAYTRSIEPGEWVRASTAVVVVVVVVRCCWHQRLLLPGAALPSHAITTQARRDMLAYQRT